MAEIKLTVGIIAVAYNGAHIDTRQEVQFEGEKLGEYREAGTGRDGGITDTRGTVETLYRAAGGRLVVHVWDWSHWQGEPDVETLHEVTEADLQPGGDWELLGAECGFEGSLTIDEALARQEYGEF